MYPHGGGGFWLAPWCSVFNEEVGLAAEGRSCCLLQGDTLLAFAAFPSWCAKNMQEVSAFNPWCWQPTADVMECCKLQGGSPTGIPSVSTPNAGKAPPCARGGCSWEPRTERGCETSLVGAWKGPTPVGMGLPWVSLV